jgi:hypothetical protein
MVQNTNVQNTMAGVGTIWCKRANMAQWETYKKNSSEQLTTP